MDCGRFVFADADALTSWVHDDSLDGLPDVVFWGKDEAMAAADRETYANGVRKAIFRDPDGNEIGFGGGPA